MAVEYEGPGQEARYQTQLQRCLADQELQYFPGLLRCQPNGDYDPAQCIAQVRSTNIQ